MTDGRPSRVDLAVCAVLAIAVFASYAPLWNAGFTNYDDTYYVTHNPHINGGITVAGLKWAFADVTNANWHPLTWLSHMLDCQLYGLNPRGHHATSVLLHVINTVLVFLVMRKITGSKIPTSNIQHPEKFQSLSSNVQSKDALGAPRSTLDERLSIWMCALVAALFGLHPVHVESVAWIAERKDVLSGLFFLLTIWAYARYARTTGQRDHGPRDNRQQDGAEPDLPEKGAKTHEKGNAGTLEFAQKESVVRSSSSVRRNSHFPYSSYYFLALVLFALGLMSKPMLVTMPFVLLLLDVWPLGRTVLSPTSKVQSQAGETSAAPSGPCGVLNLLREKILFFALAGIVSVVTFVAQRAGGAMPTIEQMSLWARLANAVHSYAAYIGKLLWPTDLAVIYPIVPHWPPAQMFISAALVLGVSLFVWAERARRPYLFAGWCWFLGMLVPVIGLVQVGNQAMADRYTYLPSIGFFVMIVWTLGALVSRTSALNVPMMALMALLLCCCGAITWVQAGYWKNSETLFQHAIRVTRNNYIAYNSLGFDAFDRGALTEAKKYFETTLSINPSSDVAWAQLGAIAVEQNDLNSGSNACVQALELNPRNPGALATLGLIDVKSGKLNEGIAMYRAAIQIKPDLQVAHYNLANALARQGNLADALMEFEQAVQLDPGSADAHNNFGFLLLRSGRAEQAVEQFRAALALKPGLWQARFGLGNALEKTGRHEEAARELNTVRQEHPEVFRARTNAPEGNVKSANQ